MSVFCAGIVWDPREPPPQEYTESALATVLPAAVGQTAQFHRTPQSPFKYQDPIQRIEYRKVVPRNVVEEQDRNILPAVSVSIEVHITGDIAEVVVRQLFWNDADVPIYRGSYTFGLPNGCTVTGFTCRIGNKKVLKATTLPKGEAQEAFQRAVASHTTAALLDQNTPEILTTSLGNIPPNARIKTEITYATILKRRFGVDTNTTTLTIPTYIANRYGQLPASLEGLSLDTKPEDISLRIEILESEHIQSIESASHEILVERGTEIGRALKWNHIASEPFDIRHETAIVTMKESASWIETDFVLSIDTECNKGIGGAEAWLEIHPSFENQAAMMVTLPPSIFRNEISKSGEILLVADRSGSMEDKMGNLRSAMKFFLKGIPMGFTFNVWSFGSSHEALWGESQVYGPGTLQIALNYVETKFYADMGGTEILPVLQAIVAARDTSLPCRVIILTDGEVWRLDETLSLVRRANGSSNGAIRFFSLGLGTHVSHALVEGIAKAGGGYSEVIPRADKNGWEERVVAMLKAALTACSHTCTLRLELDGIKAMTSPASLDSLNIFRDHRIFLLLEQGTIQERGTTALTLVSDGKRTPINTSIVRGEKTATLIHSLSARAILDDLERGIVSTTHWADGQAQNISDLAESIGCKYSVASKWTSLFLANENEVWKGGIAYSTSNGIMISRVSDGSLQNPRGLSKNLSKHHFGAASIYKCLPMDSPRPFHSPGGQAHIAPSYPPNIRSRMTSTSTEEEFISFILSHQAFDGSIASGVLNELPKAGRDIIDALKNWLYKNTSLRDPVLDLVANATLIIEILERDYKEFKDLWAMIQLKALAYIRLHVPQSNIEDELLEYTRDRLEQLDGRAYRKRGEPSSCSTEERRKKRLDSNEEGETQTGPSESSRVLVRQAPID
ncbi:von Willebrand factor type A domain-containing protein [Xylaria grammica]|nr:von Willebrand factor type A domain-containing protein [Xylaria grammica]